MTRNWLISLAILISSASFAQQPVRQELTFIRHLMSRSEFKESLFLLEGLEAEEQSLKDSIDFLKGWILYQQKQLEASAENLLRVSPHSSLFGQSRFFASYNLAHTGELLLADSILGQLTFPAGSLEDALLNFEQGGLALLRRDYETFDMHASRFSGAFNPFAAEERNLGALAIELKDQPMRSPLLAGVLSSAIPGLGKIYAGKTAEGIASFLYVGAMGLTTFDFYRRLGPQNGFFILSAAVTGVFYAGNIWGSAVAVTRHQNEFRHEMDQRILFDMHIPLRNIFR